MKNGYQTQRNRQPVPLDERTSARLSRVRGRDTRPEREFRAALLQLGVELRANDGEVPGRPDVVDWGTRVAIFIDGCFWHGHGPCYRAPVHNAEYWRNKIKYNLRRRTAVAKQLKSEGWRVMRFWECEIRRDPVRLAKIVKRRLDRQTATA